MEAVAAAGEHDPPVVPPPPLGEGEDEPELPRRRKTRGLNVWSVEQICPPSIETAAEATTEEAGAALSDSERSDGSTVWTRTSSRRSSFASDVSDGSGGCEFGSEGTRSRRSSVSSEGSSGGYASDASSGGYTSDASSGGYASDASSGYASSDGEGQPGGRSRRGSFSVLCRGHPLHHAAGSGDHAAVHELIAAGENEIDECDKYGCTPLHRAAHHGNVEIVAAILRAQADVSLTNDNGHTALHRACMRGQSAAVGLLLAAGARHDARDDPLLHAHAV